MGLLEELAANNIDPDKFIALQHEFIIYCRSREDSKEAENYRDYLDRDQFLTMVEKFINKLDRDRLREKMEIMTKSSSSL